jgi:hypothetical protein
MPFSNPFYRADLKVQNLGERNLELDIARMEHRYQPLASYDVGPSSSTRVNERDTPDGDGASLPGGGSEAVDRNWSHLYPLFRQKLELTLREVEQLTGVKWVLEEGYRSQDRQTALYAQGRTRGGPIVTWMKTPKYHGTGLAADVRPQQGYQVPRSYWETLRKVYTRYGLDNPAWYKGDLGHVQLSDPQTHNLAEEWVNRGFS